MPENKMEIFLPQSIGLNEDVKGTVSKIQRKRGNGLVVHPPFSDADHLIKLLNESIELDPNVKRIVISESGIAEAIGSVVSKNPDKFVNVRLLNITLSKNYPGLDKTGRRLNEDEKDEQSVVQADIITRAILARLMEKDSNPFVRNLLKAMLKNRVEGKVDDFIDSLIESENEDGAKAKDRILNCLKNAVSLVEKIGEQLVILKSFVWTAA